jgi:AAA15 family ATPase/GTPase
LGENGTGKSNILKAIALITAASNAIEYTYNNNEFLGKFILVI